LTSFNTTYFDILPMLIPRKRNPTRVWVWNNENN